MPRETKNEKRTEERTLEHTKIKRSVFTESVKGRQCFGYDADVKISGKRKV